MTVIEPSRRPQRNIRLQSKLASRRSKAVPSAHDYRRKTNAQDYPAAPCWRPWPPHGLPRFAIAQPKQKIRIGVPTKTYWPTIVCETAIRQKLFDKEGLDCELTIYRGGAEGFEAIAAGAADLILNSSSSVAAGLKKGVNVRCVANGVERLLRLVPGREAGLQADQGRGARRQEGRHHLGRLGLRHPGAVDASPRAR